MIKVNVEVWSANILDAIREWRNYRDCWCNGMEKHSVGITIDRLEGMLETLLNSGEVSEANFEWFTTLL